MKTGLQISQTYNASIIDDRQKLCYPPNSKAGKEQPMAWRHDRPKGGKRLKARYYLPRWPCWSCLRLRAAVAHDGSATISYTGVGVDGAQTSYHDETLNNPNQIYKGHFTVNTTNTTGIAWTDFHFVIPSPAIFPGDAGVVFGVDGDASPPTSSQSGLSWVLSADKTEIDSISPSNPVAPGAAASFTVWTDNTANTNSMFAVLTYPTNTAVVPEPGGLLALAVGVFGMIGLVRKKTKTKILLCQTGGRIGLRFF